MLLFKFLTYLAGRVTKTVKTKLAVAPELFENDKMNGEDENGQKFSANPFGGSVATNPFESPFGGSENPSKKAKCNYLFL